MTCSSNLRRTGLALLGLGVTAAAFAFTFTRNKNTGLPIKWPAGVISVTIMLGDTTTLFDGSNYNTSARAAALAWNVVIGSAQLQTQLAAAGSATEQTGSTPPQPPINELAFAPTIFGRDFGENTLAVTTGFSRGNERTEADIIFNTKKFTWDSYRGSRPASLPSGTVDLQRVAIHELGHLLGLDHPNEADPIQFVNAIMNSQISLNVDTLTADDIEGARSLYGPPGVPANNNFSNAIAITAVPFGAKGHNTLATKEAAEPDHANNPGGRSVWWQWTAPSNGSVTLDTRGSYYDTTLGVYTGTTVSNLTLIASDDDIEDGVIQASTITFNVTGGTVYRIAVDGFNNIVQNAADTAGADNGGITLTLNFTAVTGAPVITTQPASVTVTVGGSATFSVGASGNEPLSYQWFFSDAQIAGATGSTFSITSAQLSNAGTYRVRVTNTLGTAVSNDASLTVNQPPAPPAPPPSSGGGGGGGGAPSLWFCAVLAALGLSRCLRRRP